MIKANYDDLGSRLSDIGTHWYFRFELGGGLLVISLIYCALGLPLEALAILLAVNPITDRFYTTANVIANKAMTAVLSRGVERDGVDGSWVGTAAIAIV